MLYPSIHSFVHCRKPSVRLGYIGFAPGPMTQNPVRFRCALLRSGSVSVPMVHISLNSTANIKVIEVTIRRRGTFMSIIIVQPQIWTIQLHWFLDSLVHLFIHSLIHWIIDALMYGFIGCFLHLVTSAWMLSCYFNCISTTICWFVDAPRTLSHSLLISHSLLNTLYFFGNFRLVWAGHYLLLMTFWCTLVPLDFRGLRLLRCSWRHFLVHLVSSGRVLSTLFLSRGM